MINTWLPLKYWRFLIDSRKHDINRKFYWYYKTKTISFNKTTYTCFTCLSTHSNIIFYQIIIINIRLQAEIKFSINKNQTPLSIIQVSVWRFFLSQKISKKNQTRDTKSITIWFSQNKKRFRKVISRCPIEIKTIRFRVVNNYNLNKLPMLIIFGNVNENFRK